MGILLRASDINVDGTFRVAPTGYMQVFTFFVRMGKPWPFSRLEDVQEAFAAATSLNDVLQASAEANGMQGALAFKSAQLDFELAPSLALRVVFNPHMLIIGCLFHFTQCIYTATHDIMSWHFSSISSFSLEPTWKCLGSFDFFHYVNNTH